jgi:hypothetical protein
MGSSHESPAPSHQVAFDEFFRTATGFSPPAPYDYQRRLATEVCANGPRSLAINVNPLLKDRSWS